MNRLPQFRAALRSVFAWTELMTVWQWHFLAQMQRTQIRWYLVSQLPQSLLVKLVKSKLLDFAATQLFGVVLVRLPRIHGLLRQLLPRMSC
jgi:hypothetical protein